MTDNWNFDISALPREAGKLVILATQCGKVTISKWLPKESRWMMLGSREQPIAWQIYPTHPKAGKPRHD